MKEVRINIDENRTPSLSVGKEESKKFILGVLGKKISKTSSGKQRFGAGRSKSVACTKQLGEFVASVKRRPLCSRCKRSHTR